MRIDVFSADSNPAVDRRLFRQSQARCEVSVASGQLAWLDSEDKSAGCRVIRQGSKAGADFFPELVKASHEAASNTAITCSEMQANVGIGSEGAVKRAQYKVKAWMSHATSDQRSPLPRGKWADFSGIQVSVVQ